MKILKFKLQIIIQKFRVDASKYLLKVKKKYKLNINIVILFNHDSKYRNQRFLLPRLIKAIKTKKYQFLKKIYLENINGDFTNAFDICYGLYLLVKKNKNPDKIILCSGKKTFINDIIDFFIPNFKNKINHDEIGCKSLNIGNNSKSVKMLDWKIKKNFLDAAKEIFKEMRI